MARAQYGSIITDIIGSIGGLTFQHNRSGKIIRIKPAGRKTPTFNQNARIMAFQDAVNLWATATQAQKEAWNTFADTYTFYNNWGEEKALNGYNWFLSINSYLKLCGESMRVAVGSYSSPLAIPTYTPLFKYNEISIDFGSSFSHTSHYLLIWTTSPIRNNNPNNRNYLRLTKIVSPDSDTKITFTSDWESTHELSLPLTGGTSNLGCIFSVQSVHDTDAIASVFRSYYSGYVSS